MEWTKKCKEACLDLKETQCKVPVLAMPTFSYEYGQQQYVDRGRIISEH